MEPLYLSGLLRKRLIKFYWHTLCDYDSEKITFVNPQKRQKFAFTYMGEIITTPDNNSFKEELRSLQEQRLQEGMKEISALTLFKFGPKKWNLNGQMVAIKTEVENLMAMIMTSERKYSFALLTCLYKIMVKANVVSIKDDLANLATLINFLELNGHDLKQIDIDLICQKFCENSFLIWSNLSYYIPELKKNVFHLDEDELDLNCRQILFLGEFIAPQKVAKIAPLLLEQNAKSSLIAQIYLLLNNEQLATKIWQLQKVEDITTPEIIDYLSYQTPVSYAINELIRKKN